MNVLGSNIALLMPANLNWSRTRIRYAGLVEALAELSVNCFIVEGHVSYLSESQTFNNAYDLRDDRMHESGRATLVHDFTMAIDNKPIYDLGSDLKLVHNHDTDRFLAYKPNMLKAAPGIHPHTIIAALDDILEAACEIPGDRIIIKPVTGMRSKDVSLQSKKRLSILGMSPGNYMLQEFIDTSHGIPHLGVKGSHNIRSISIGGKLIGSIARVGGSELSILKDDVYGAYIDNEHLPDTMHQIVDEVHLVLDGLPGKGQNIVAIDMMRGIDAAGEQVDKLCEVNRRPVRISAYNLTTKENHDEPGLMRLAGLWDIAEAKLLAGQIG